MLHFEVESRSTWQVKYSGNLAYQYFTSVFFVGKDSGWACGYGGMIVRTINGGENWESCVTNTSEELVSIKFIDSQHGWAVGGNVILSTSDGGVNWAMQTNLGEYPLTCVAPVDAQKIWATGENGLLMRADHGNDWQVLHAGGWQYIRRGDDVDLYPDVFVARASVETPDEARSFFHKLINYEKNPPTDYQNKMLFIGADLDEATHTGWAKDSIEAWYVTSQFIPITKLYPYNIPPAPQLNRTEVINRFNQGYGIVNHSDHAEHYRWGTGCKTGGGYIYRNDIEELTNFDKPSVIYSLSCHAAAFDYDCIAEHFLTANSGAVAFIGNSRYGYYKNGDPSHGASNLYDQQFYKALLPDNCYQLGTAHAIAKSSLIGFCGSYYTPMRWCQLNLNVFGDPEMPVWTDLPKHLAVDHPSSVNMGPNSILITVADSITGLPIDSAYVCLQKGVEAYATGYTDNNGQITFDYTPESTGEANITVTAQNYLPNCGTITVLPTYKYICYESSELDDDDLGGTAGNGDGIANPGETVDMLVTMKNNGTLPVSRISIDLTTNSVYITPNILNTSRRESILPGGTGNCDQPCRFTVAANCPDNQRVIFQMYATAGAYAWADSFVVVVNADSLEHTGHGLVELSGNGNGLIEPGETIKVTEFEATNFGSGGAGGVVAELATDDPYINILNGNIAIGVITADDTASEPDGFTFSVSPSAPAGRVYEFTLTLRDRFDRQWIKSDFKLVPITANTGLAASSAVEGVELKWNPVASAIGYHIYRSQATGGQYARLNKHAVKQASLYLDSDALPNEQYYYVVTALDSSYNESIYSNEASVVSPLAYKTGWPQNAGTRGDLNWNAALPGDIDGDGDKEVVLGTNDGHIFAWHHDGSTVNGWPKNFPNALISAALVDIDKCGLPEVIAGIGDASSFRLIIYKDDGSILCDHTLYTGTGTQSESFISAGDIDRDGVLDLIVGCKNVSRVYALSWNGTGLTQKWVNSTLQTVGPSGSPTGAAIADIDGDGFYEVMVSTASAEGLVYAWYHNGSAVPSWPVKLMPGATYAVILCLPAAVDLDGDGKDEIIVETANAALSVPKDTMYIVSGNGAISSKWQINGRTWGSPALANIDNDGSLEIIACMQTTNGLAAWNHDGSLCWQANTGATHSSPALCDINNDGTNEILTGTDAQRVLGYGATGSMLPGFPIPMAECTYSAPFACDLDGNGKAELGMDMFDGKVHVWEYTENASNASEWPMFHHDAMSSGRYGWLNEFSGHIARNLVLLGDNFFNGDVAIDPGVTVTLKPGTRMYFTANRDVKNIGIDPSKCELIVNGNLIAQATETDSIRFLTWSNTPASGDWSGIKVEAGGMAQINYCVVENADNGIACMNSSPQISNSRIQGCNTGIYVSGGNPIIQSSHIIRNQNTGIYCEQSAAQISGNLIANNGYEAKDWKAFSKLLADSSTERGKDSTSMAGTGIESYGSNMTVTGNVIRENFTGYYSSGDIQGTITGNTFEDNVFQGIDMMASSFNVAINNNTFIRNGGIYDWRWELAGISLGYRSLTGPSSIQIENNVFEGNFAGARCTRYGRQPTNSLALWVRNNTFAAGNRVGLAVSTDSMPNLQAIAINNSFEKNTDYGVYINARNRGVLNLGDLGNDFKGDDGGNRFSGNYLYDIYNWVRYETKAEGNFWHTKDPKEIDDRIYDDNENPLMCGPVDFKPFLTWGPLTQDESWGGVVSLGGDVTVPAGRTLSIKPGTTVRFLSNDDGSVSGNDTSKTELIVYGNLVFKGKPGEPPVTFESEAYLPQPGDWGGITFSLPNKGNMPVSTVANKSEAEGSKSLLKRELKNIVVKHAGCGLKVELGQLLTLKNGSFEQNITGTFIRDTFDINSTSYNGNTQVAAHFADAAHGALKDCSYDSNAVGLLFEGTSKAECKDISILSSTETGVICRDQASPAFSDALIKGNKECGVKIYDNAQPILGNGDIRVHNIFEENRPYHVRNLSSGDIQAMNNYWSSMDADTIDAYIWDGHDQTGMGFLQYMPIWDGPTAKQLAAQSSIAENPALPKSFKLGPSLPNPARTEVSIRYQLPEKSEVHLKVYNALGQLVKTVFEGNQEPGYYLAGWNLRNSAGVKVSAGVYIYHLTAGKHSAVGRMVVLK